MYKLLPLESLTYKQLQLLARDEGHKISKIPLLKGASGVSGIGRRKILSPEEEERNKQMLIDYITKNREVTQAHTRNITEKPVETKKYSEFVLPEHLKTALEDVKALDAKAPPLRKPRQEDLPPTKLIKFTRDTKRSPEKANVIYSSLFSILNRTVDNSDLSQRLMQAIYNRDNIEDSILNVAFLTPVLYPQTAIHLQLSNGTIQPDEVLKLSLDRLVPEANAEVRRTIRKAQHVALEYIHSYIHTRMTGGKIPVKILTIDFPKICPNVGDTVIYEDGEHYCLTNNEATLAMKTRKNPHTGAPIPEGFSWIDVPVDETEIDEDEDTDGEDDFSPKEIGLVAPRLLDHLFKEVNILLKKEGYQTIEIPPEEEEDEGETDEGEEGDGPLDKDETDEDEGETEDEEEDGPLDEDETDEDKEDESKEEVREDHNNDKEDSCNKCLKKLTEGVKSIRLSDEKVVKFCGTKCLSKYKV
jgi:hypothetical protein